MMSPEEHAKARAQAMRWMKPIPPQAPPPPRTRLGRGLPIGVYHSYIAGKPWRVRIKVGERLISLGAYATVAEAAAVALAGAKQTIS
jgi:hypothetical protein